MKILFFSPYFYPYTSGVTTYPLKILSYLAKKNKITVLTFHHDHKLSNQVTHNQITINRMPYLFKISKGFISPQSLIYFLKYTKLTDLIILNQPNFEGLFLALIGKMFRKKIISIFHCQVFLEGNLITKIINSVLNISMKIQLNLSDKIVVYTKDYISSLPYFEKLKNKTLEVLPPIEKVEEDKIFLNKLLIQKNKNIWIGYAGRISSEKGIEYLLQSIKRLKYKKNIKLIFAGPYGKNVAGENNYYNKIIKLLKEYGIKHFFLGNLTSEQLFAFYKTIDLLVLPSINQTEAFGMVQAEAMIAGTPVIASNLPGVRISIRLTKMGIIVEPKDIKQISVAINKVLENKNKYSNHDLVEKAKKIFDIRKIYQFYDQLLTSL
ncbi:MAG: glycosyltransferase family 4 protein [Patescibacteria group bacterium]